MVSHHLHKVFMPEQTPLLLGKVINSGQLSYGDYTNKFEKGIQNYLDNKNFLTLSGNSVLFALDFLDIGLSDEVIASPMSCLMTNQPVAVKGANIVWADIDPSTGTLDPESVKSKISKNTKAILHYHWGGNPGYIDEINKIAHDYGVVVIEEASTAFGSEYKNKKIGNTNSDIVCFSFTAVRLPNAVNGYGIAFKNSNFYDKAILKRDFGIDRARFRDDNGEISEKCDIKLTGLGLVLDNVSSAVGYSQLSHIEDLYSKQRANAKKWDSYFSNDKSIKIIGDRREINPNYWVYSLLSDKRDELYQEFKTFGFGAGKLHYRNDKYSVFKNTLNKSSTLKGVDEFEKKQLNIPSGWWISTNEIKI